MTCQVVNSEVVVGLMTVAYAFSILERTATRSGGLFNCLFLFEKPAVSNLSASNSGAKWPSGDVGAKCAMRVC